MITVANAPVSYGVFDLARPELVPPPGGGELLDAVAAAGYDAVDLGPRGLFGTGRALADALAGRGHHQMIDDPGLRQALRGPPQQAPPADLDERLGAARAQSGSRSRSGENGDDGAVPVRCASGAGRGGVDFFGAARGPPYVDSHVVSAGFARRFRRLRRGRGQAAVPEDRTSSSLDSATSSAVFSASASSETRI